MSQSCSTDRPAPAAAPKAGKPPYPPPAQLPSQTGTHGIRFDFNSGCRVVLPERAGKWRVTLRDLDSGNIVYRNVVARGLVCSVKQWFIRFGVEVTALTEDEQEDTAVCPFTHEYNARGHEVLVQFPIGTLGDTLAWMPYAARFAQLHACRLTCALSGLIAPLLREAYPHVRFVTHDEVRDQALAEQMYATYSLGLFFNDTERRHQPTDFRLVGLHRTAAYILGVDPAEEPARIAVADRSRPLAEPYVVIAVQASTQAKMWNNPQGWPSLVTWLKQRGLRVICIDQKPVGGAGIVWTHLPHGVQDETGDRPLAERARWLSHAECFIGVSSGLAWLAWSAGCPVVMVSGFTHPTNEFSTPYRVINWHGCNSCWNDPQVRFDHTDHLWCPNHKNTPRHFECSRLITAEAVIAATSRALSPACAVSRHPAAQPAVDLLLPKAAERPLPVAVMH